MFAIWKRKWGIPRTILISACNLCALYMYVRILIDHATNVLINAHPQIWWKWRIFSTEEEILFIIVFWLKCLLVRSVSSPYSLCMPLACYYTQLMLFYRLFEIFCIQTQCSLLCPNKAYSIYCCGTYMITCTFTSMNMYIIACMYVL